MNGWAGMGVERRGVGVEGLGWVLRGWGGRGGVWGGRGGAGMGVEVVWVAVPGHYHPRGDPGTVVPLGRRPSLPSVMDTVPQQGND